MRFGTKHVLSEPALVYAIGEYPFDYRKTWVLAGGAGAATLIAVLEPDSLAPTHGAPATAACQPLHAGSHPTPRSAAPTEPEPISDSDVGIAPRKRSLECRWADG